MEHTEQPTAAAASGGGAMEGPLMLPLASSSDRSVGEQRAGTQAQRRRRAGTMRWGPAWTALLLVLVVASLVSSSSCLAFAPPPAGMVGLRRHAAAATAAGVGSSGLPTLPAVVQRASRGRRAGRADMALRLFKGKRMPVGAGVSVSLDKRVIPLGAWPESGPRLLLGAVATLFLFVVIGQLPFMAGVHNAIRGFCERHNVELYDKLAYRYRLLKGRLERIRDGLRRRWQQMHPREVTVLPASAFPVPLTLLERTYIGGAFMKYRFAFPGPTQTMELDLGQQVSLIGSTADDRVMKAHFIPLSERGEPGILEIVSEKNDPDDPAVRILDTLAIGESIQCTPGARLTNQHPGPINKLLLVVSKLGVVPALQFLKALLPTSGGYSVDYANVVWVNERQDQYILHEELQALFYKYNAKLDVFTVAERDLFMGDLGANQQFRVSIPQFTADTLAIVAGPEYFVTKAQDYLKKAGYAEDVIVTL